MRVAVYIEREEVKSSLLVVCGLQLAGVDQLSTHVDQLVLVGLMELGLDFTLLVRHIVPLVTLHGVGKSLLKSFVVTQCVISLILACIQLLLQLIGCDDFLLVIHLLHGEVYQVIVSLGLLCCVGERVHA